MPLRDMDREQMWLPSPRPSVSFGGFGLRAEREEAFEELFVEVLRLCHEAGLVKLGVVALDGTKVAANAALATNRSHQAIEEEVQRMLAEAKAMDAEEDAHYGPARRGDELPEGLGGRRERLKRAVDCLRRFSNVLSISRPPTEKFAVELVSEVVPKALTSFVQNDIGCLQRH